MNKPMFDHLSLSNRVNAAFIACFLVLSAVSTVMIYGACKGVEDFIFDRELEAQIQSYQNAKLSGQEFHLNYNITMFETFESIPKFLSNYMTETAPGTYELDHPKDIDYHYGVSSNVDGKPIYFIYDVNDIEMSEDIEAIIMDFVMFCFLVFLIIFLLIFTKVTKAALKPMYQLVNQVEQQSAQPNQPIQYKYVNDNEIGLLGKAIEGYSHKLHDYIKREQEFSGFASHELRTPVAVIKGALDIVKLQPENQKLVSRSIGRISRATLSMENTIQTLLVLSREQHNQEVTLGSLDTSLRNVLENYQTKLAENNKQVFMDGQLDCVENIDQVAAEIVMSNLIRNAIQHSVGDRIHLVLNGNELTVINALNDEGVAPANSTATGSIHEQGYGLGKAIVDRVCEQHNWQVEEQVQGSEYKVVVTFIANS